MLLGMAFQVGCLEDHDFQALKQFAGTDDLVRYMKAAMSDGNNFLIDDPVWAEDFAPNGMPRVLFAEPCAD